MSKSFQTTSPQPLPTEELLLSLRYSQLKQSAHDLFAQSTQDFRGAHSTAFLDMTTAGCILSFHKPTPNNLGLEIRNQRTCQLEYVEFKVPSLNTLKGERDLGSAEQHEETALPSLAGFHLIHFSAALTNEIRSH